MRPNVVCRDVHNLVNPMITVLSLTVPVAVGFLWAARAGGLSAPRLHLGITDLDLVLDLADGFERRDG